MSEKKIKNPPKKKNHELTFEQSKDKIAGHLVDTVRNCAALIHSEKMKVDDPNLLELITNINAATSRVMSQCQWHEFFWSADGTRKQELPEAP